MIDIDGFTIEAELGRGGFGAVYRATDHAHGRDVAIKVLDRFDDESARRRFDRERRAMGTLSGHPNIGVVHSSGFTNDQRPFIVMELLRGGSLNDLLDSQGPMSAADVVGIGTQLCDALAHAHVGGVLHLDMKPENVLMSEFGTVKVVDFGIAALVDDQRTSTIHATPAFADPRVLEGESGTASSDVYGLAATLYTLLAGTTPYASASGGLGTFNRIANDPVPRIDRADVPPALADCIQAAMSKDPSGRPASMLDFRQQLIDATQRTAPASSAPQASSDPSTRIISTATPIAPGPVPSVPEAPKRDRSSVIGLALLALAGLLLVGFAVLAVRGEDESPDGELVAVADDSVAPQSTVTQTPTTVAPTTSAPTPTTLVPAIVTPTVGPTVSNPRFSLQTNAGLPDPEVFVIPDGSTQLCLTWTYENVEPGAEFEFGWLIDGELDPGSRMTGTNQGGANGEFFGCVTNSAGLPSGVFEARWTVEGDTVFTHGTYVGGDRRGVSISVQNPGSEAVCDVYWSPVGADPEGIPANTSVIEPGGRFETILPTGRYQTVVRDCSGMLVFEDADTEFADEDVLTLPV